MGTKLVPSIENIEGCQKWGGKWDHKNEFCYKEENDGSGCTAPYKGINFCWGETEYEDRLEDYNTGKMSWVELHRPDVSGYLSFTDDYFYDSNEGSYRSPDEDYDTRTEAMDHAKQWAFQEFADHRHGPCYTPRGKPIDCDKTNAVSCPDPKFIVNSYQKYFYREKPLYDDMFSETYISKPKETRYKHTNQIRID